MICRWCRERFQRSGRALYCSPSCKHKANRALHGAAPRSTWFDRQRAYQLFRLIPADEVKRFNAGDVWFAEVRKAALARDGGCFVCSSTGQRLAAHHRTYERWGGREVPSDIVTLCPGCHRTVHTLADKGVCDLYTAHEYLKAQDSEPVIPVQVVHVPSGPIKREWRTKVHRHKRGKVTTTHVSPEEARAMVRGEISA